MSMDPHKWFRKRPAEDDDLEVLSDHHHDGDHEREDESVWKVKTLDEILQEKRKRLEEEEEGDKEEEPAIERERSELASRSSSVAASPGPVNRERLSSSPDPAEVIYQLSPGQQSYSSLSSGGATPSGSKPLAPQEVSKVKSREGKRRRPTEEEEGEIVSEGSEHDDEAKPKSRGSRHGSVGDVEMKSQGSTEEGNKDGSEKAEGDEESNDDESSESESEVEEVVQMGEQPNLKVGQEKEKEEQHTESDDSEESDNESEDESGDKSSEEEETQMGSVKNETSKEKNKKGDDNEAGKDDDDDDDDDDDEEEEDESESEDESSEDSESENEQPGKEPVVKESPKVVDHIDEEETEDIHKELLRVTESQKQKERAKKQRKYDTDKTRRDRSHGYDDRSQKSKEYTRASDSRKYQERDKWQVEDQWGRKEYPSREQSYEKKDTRHREKNIERSSNSRRLMEKSRSKESIGPRNQPKEKYSTITRDVPPKSSKRDLGTWKSPRESDSSRKDTKSSENPKKESKESRDYRRGPREEKKRKQIEKSRDTEKPVKTERAAGRKDVESSVLTEQERKQFSREVVDLESDGGSSTDENVPSPHSVGEHKSDTEMHSDKEEKEPERPKLPLYLPAIRGCRNVEEFQWLNRIEEGTYGVVYRAKDKRTSEIVALKRLKMEKEKEGFPITSLREINTLLKSQHPNIVTVREIVVGSNMDKIYIVMDYVEHDLKALMEHMPNPFLAGEVKTLMIQLLRAVAHLHDNWILHRDLKTSNLLLSNKGILKVGDFGLAREYGSPLRHYTPIVVTLWYRAPELLLGVKEYSTPIDLWSVGCIFAELLTMKPLFPGRSEIDQINKIFKELGTPSDKIWPGPPSYSELPAVKKMTFTEYPYNNLRNKFGAYLTDKGFDLLNRFLTYDPQKRITAEQALKHGFFTESPMPVDPSMFPSWPAKSELTKRPKRKDYEHSPQAPEGGASFAKLGEDDSGGFHIATLKKGSSHVPGFSLKF